MKINNERGIDTYDTHHINLITLGILNRKY